MMGTTRGKERDGYPRKEPWMDSRETNPDLHFVVNHQSSYGPVTSFLKASVSPSTKRSH